LPIAPGIAGIRKKKTIITPWRVKARLYMSDDIISPSGVSRSSRNRKAAAPPTKKKKVTDNI
jgi:hypothetical protein